ncbi:hypothetical protein SM124_06535 [Bacillus sp. 31A1R]|uniref:Uncharacterized protein n=1 Tax=Robertmurraya mangrovi TaxID=3098077 RepID=A0ABU5IW87_9BACI|nr:hypothetical protein [Bacillus sp. 31A1R]MDZ5471401.1 hypothetical protein [Bacillus sp. 31A1R]
MEKAKLALNHAIMIEIIRKHGLSNEGILGLLEEGKIENFYQFGEGIPDWQTFIQFYENQKDRLVRAITHGYQITFLTKGALKSLLGIKFGVENFEDCGTYLDGIILSKTQLFELQGLISINWKIIEKEVVDEEHHIKIELTKPV